MHTDKERGMVFLFMRIIIVMTDSKNRILASGTRNL
jgi:hypothetical protein